MYMTTTRCTCLRSRFLRGKYHRSLDRVLGHPESVVQYFSFLSAVSETECEYRCKMRITETTSVSSVFNWKFGSEQRVVRRIGPTTLPGVQYAIICGFPTRRWFKSVSVQETLVAWRAPSKLGSFLKVGKFQNRTVHNTNLKRRFTKTLFRPIGSDRFSLFPLTVHRKPHQTSLTLPETLLFKFQIWFFSMFTNSIFIPTNVLSFSNSQPPTQHPVWFYKDSLIG